MCPSSLIIYCLKHTFPPLPSYLVKTHSVIICSVEKIVFSPKCPFIYENHKVALSLRFRIQGILVSDKPVIAKTVDNTGCHGRFQGIDLTDVSTRMPTKISHVPLDGQVQPPGMDCSVS